MVIEGKQKKKSSSGGVGVKKERERVCPDRFDGNRRTKQAIRIHTPVSGRGNRFNRIHLQKGFDFAINEVAAYSLLPSCCRDFSCLAGLCEGEEGGEREREKGGVSKESRNELNVTHTQREENGAAYGEKKEHTTPKEDNTTHSVYTHSFTQRRRLSKPVFKKGGTKGSAEPRHTSAQRGKKTELHQQGHFTVRHGPMNDPEVYTHTHTYQSSECLWRTAECVAFKRAS